VATSDLFLFVSHVAENRISAMEIVDELERRGTRCWIAPRDVRPGEPFDDQIADAIDACRGMVLIFSELCNDSEYIRREVTVAGESHKPVIPFRIEDVQPRRGLRVRLSDLHWIDGFVSRERAVDEVIKKFPPIASGSSGNAPAAPARRDDSEQLAKQVPPKPADTAGSEPQIEMGIAETTATKQTTTQDALDRVSSKNVDGKAAPASRERDSEKSAAPADSARTPLKSHGEEILREREEGVPRTVTAARSNINSLRIVSALLVLQGIVRAGLAIYVLNLRLNDFFGIMGPNQFALLTFLAKIWIPWGLVTIIVASQIARQRKWAPLCGLILCSVGILHDALFGGAIGVVWTPFFLMLHFLFLVVDIVAVIYLFKHRRRPRAT
jgi:hypothetical protein